MSKETGLGDKVAHRNCSESKELLVGQVVAGRPVFTVGEENLELVSIWPLCDGVASLFCN